MALRSWTHKETQDGEKSAGSPSHWEQATGLQEKRGWGGMEARARGRGGWGLLLRDGHWRRQKTRLQGFPKLKMNFKLQPPG